MKEFIIRRYQKGDEHLINKGFNQIFGLQRPIQEWYWKFKNPNDSRIMLSLHKGELLSHFAVQVERFQYQGAIYNAGHGVDVYSIQKARVTSGMFFQKLVHAFFSEFGGEHDLALRYGFPGERHLKLGILKLDYGRALPVKYWELEAQFKDRSFQDGFNHPGTPSRINRLWANAAKRYPVSIIRDYKWIHKRYLSKPNQRYQFIRRSSWGRYSMLCVYLKKKGVLEVVDVVWDGQSEKDIKFLTSALASIAHRNGIVKISMWLSGDQKLEQIIEKYGWRVREEPQKLQLVVKSYIAKIDRDELLDRFYLTKGCTDLI